MAKAVQVTWAASSQVVENGSLYTQYLVRLVPTDVGTPMEKVVPLTETTYTFASVDAWEYTAAVHLTDDLGAVAGPGVTSDPFRVIDDARLDVPMSVQVTMRTANG